MNHGFRSWDYQGHDDQRLEQGYLEPQRNPRLTQVASHFPKH